MRFFAAVRDASGLPVSDKVDCRSSDPKIVAIHSTGLATAAFSGIVLSTTIVATSGSGSKSAAITVQPCLTNCGMWSTNAGLAYVQLGTSPASSILTFTP